RYRRDIAELGNGRDNVQYLGDILITAFPLTRWSDPRTLIIPADIKQKPVPLDRFIQHIQRYRRVESWRLHPLLCALTSADEVAYKEQTEDPRGTVSGKFAAMLEDVFGSAFPPETFVHTDRPKVAAYKEQVTRNLETVRQTLAALLA